MEPLIVLTSQLVQHYSPKDLAGQVRLSRSARRPVIESWSLHSIGDWHLEAAPGVPVRKLVSWTGGGLWIIGHVLDVSGALKAVSQELPTAPADTDVVGLLRKLAGRWWAAAIAPTYEHVYLDGAGTLPLVFSRNQQCLATSECLVPGNEPQDDEVELVESLWQSNESFIPFGLTSRKSVRRLLPNHRLDLRAFGVHRYHPVAPPKETPRLESTVDAITGYLVEIVRLACEGEGAYLALTSGRDSRILLACTPDDASGLKAFTWELPDAVARRDVQDAVRLAAIRGIPHFIESVQAPTADGSQRWVFRTGGSVVSDRAVQAALNLTRMDAAARMIVGIAGEVGRGFYWNSDDERGSAGTTVSAPWLLQRIDAPRSPAMLDAASAWLEGLPVSDAPDVLDFAYIELRLGCWSAPCSLGAEDGPRRIYPYAGAALFNLLLSLPRRYRARDQLAEDVVRRLRPELLVVPFNRPATWRRHVAAVLSRTPLIWRLARHV